MSGNQASKCITAYPMASVKYIHALANKTDNILGSDNWNLSFDKQ